LQIPCKFCFILKNDDNFKSNQKMFIVIMINFIYYKLKHCSIHHKHYTLYMCGKALYKIWNSKTYLGENMVKGARGSKVKVLFQGLHITHFIRVLVYSFVSWILNLTLHVRYKCILTKINFISFILCIHALYHINMNNFC
jgi:hypothetical protein